MNCRLPNRSHLSRHNGETHASETKTPNASSWHMPEAWKMVAEAMKEAADSKAKEK